MPANLKAVRDAALRRFSKGSYTQGVLLGQYDWQGVKTVRVRTRSTSALGNYTESGTSRYGTPANVGDTYQELACTQDKAFTYTISGNVENGVDLATEAGEQLADELDQEVIPALDEYRFGVLVAGCEDDNYTSVATTKSNAYETFLASNEKMDEAFVPKTGRVAFVAPSYFNKLKLDASFVKASDMGQAIAFTGQVGEVDGVAIVKVPASILGTDIDYVIVHTSAVAAPVKVNDYNEHVNPPGIHGVLAEGRIVHDAFILEARNLGVAVNGAARA